MQRKARRPSRLDIGHVVLGTLVRRQQRQLLDRYDGKEDLKIGTLYLRQITATNKCTVSLQWIWLRIFTVFCLTGDGSDSGSEKGSGSGSVLMVLAEEDWGIGRGRVSSCALAGNTAPAWVRHVRTQQTQNFCPMNNWQSLIFFCLYNSRIYFCTLIHLTDYLLSKEYDLRVDKQNSFIYLEISIVSLRNKRWKRQVGIQIIRHLTRK